MSRIKHIFEGLKADNRTALIPFITAGDPHPDYTVSFMHALVEGGADILELGVPFSDPMADGPVIQYSSERALKHQVSLTDVFSMVKKFRIKNTTTPVVLMGYCNPIEIMGYEKVAKLSEEVGVDGILTVDLPPEESQEFNAMLQKAGVDPVFLISPTTTPERIEKICRAATGFVYYVALKGVTGSTQLDTTGIKGKMDLIRKHTDLPVGVGFGIKDGEIAAKVSKVSDAVVVGSALVSKMEALQDRPEKISAEISNFMAELRTAIDQ
ncbi:MAG: tryptophan synthase subunit alpha [Gammaproteobacteria bacterium]